MKGCAKFILDRRNSSNYLRSGHSPKDSEYSHDVQEFSDNTGEA